MHKNLLAIALTIGLAFVLGMTGAPGALLDVAMAHTGMNPMVLLTP